MMLEGLTLSPSGSTTAARVSSRRVVSCSDGRARAGRTTFTRRLTDGESHSHLAVAAALVTLGVDCELVLTGGTCLPGNAHQGNTSTCTCGSDDTTPRELLPGSREGRSAAASPDAWA